ncbi:unnamed protein product [Adineta ricciae]|uniref:Uncharacterized protein n=1 Tax=Adineta ricciae TaxID=249248 RepID=A0A815GYA9_ADIRI|nr:unnamed protein product [Adineta ricciae]CAF1532985.1 unnamed protein product [Adineta ricciae]
MALFQRNQIGFKEEQHGTVTPANDLARLMYYFNCVCYVIQYNDSDVSRLRNCHNWASLSAAEIRLLLALCSTLSPDVFNNKVFFQSDALCGSSQNKFFEISQVSNQLLAVDSIIIAGRRYRVNKIMTYKMSWMYNNYINPMQRIAQ